MYKLLIFIQKYFNESICQNITRAKQLFFLDYIKPKQFKVSYLTSDATVDCKNRTNRKTLLSDCKTEKIMEQHWKNTQLAT